jgi:hypothetical protein
MTNLTDGISIGHFDSLDAVLTNLNGRVLGGGTLAVPALRTAKRSAPY